MTTAARPVLVVHHPTPLTDPIGRAWDTAADLVTDWRRILGYAAVYALADGADLATFTAAADAAYALNQENASPPQEPPELATRPPAEQVVWRFFRAKWQRHHLSPTIDAVRREAGFGSYSTAANVLRSLVKLGLLEHRSDTYPAYQLPARWR